MIRFESWCIFATKVELHHKMIVIDSFFGLNRKVIPLDRINTVNMNIIKEVTITTIGGEDFKIVPWNHKKRTELFSLLTSRESRVGERSK